MDVEMRESSLNIDNCLVWKRLRYVGNLMGEKECYDTMIVWRWDEVVKKINNDVLVDEVMAAKSMLNDGKVVLVIYGMEGYFMYHNNSMKHEKKKKKNKMSELYENISVLPEITRKRFELSLLEAQIMGNCSTLLIENSQEMTKMMEQYTKAIIAVPLKSLLKAKEDELLDFYASGDNKNSIKVDNDGYGLKRLWMRQLCLFNKANLAIAEAINAHYSSPTALMKVFCYD
uniref:Uncharacterized protein n=1 Tax=Bracon brevicornis TaxID=1563983 RepID=A0A6V7K797_9HYME